LLELLAFLEVEQLQLVVLDGVPFEQQFELVHFVEGQHVCPVGKAVKLVLLGQHPILDVRDEGLFGLDVDPHVVDLALVAVYYVPVLALVLHDQLAFHQKIAG
jgi:hypothetical protein